MSPTRRGPSPEDLEALATVALYLNHAPQAPSDLRDAWTEAQEALTPLLPAEALDPADTSGRTLLTATGPLAMTWGRTGSMKERRATRAVGIAVKALNRFLASARIASQLRAVRPADSRAKAGERPAITLEPTYVPLDERGYIALLLTRGLSGSVWERLRRCDQCRSWFIDRSDGQVARFCGDPCESRWWTAPRRRVSKLIGRLPRSERDELRQEWWSRGATPEAWNDVLALLQQRTTASGAASRRFRKILRQALGKAVTRRIRNARNASERDQRRHRK